MQTNKFLDTIFIYYYIFIKKLYTVRLFVPTQEAIKICNIFVKV